MAGIYHEAECISNDGRKLLFGISLGRDSSCMLELMHKRVKLQDHCFVHYSPYLTMLPYQARQLSLLERRYGISIDVRPDPVSPLVRGLRSVAEDRDFMLGSYGCGLMVLGYRMDESLQRRGMLKKFDTGINDKLRECYPLRAWTSRITEAFVRANKVLLSPEYAFGCRDFRMHRSARAALLRHFISEADYQAAIAQDPQVEIDYVRYAHKHREELISEIHDTGDNP